MNSDINKRNFETSGSKGNQDEMLLVGVLALKDKAHLWEATSAELSDQNFGPPRKD